MDPRSDPGRQVPPIVFIAIISGVVVLVLLALIAVAGVVLARTQSDSDRVPAALQVTLTRTPAGTDVALVINSVGTERLPDALDLQFTPVDDGINDDGGSLTNATMKYSQVRYGAGEDLSIDEPKVTIKDVGTDGKRASVSFTVATAAGRRVIYPVPYSSSLRFNAINVKGASTTSCLQSSGSENGRLHYFTCTIDPSGSVRYSGGSWAPESIRLELAG